jgi:hypothetical protein
VAPTTRRYPPGEPRQRRISGRRQDEGWPARRWVTDHKPQSTTEEVLLMSTQAETGQVTGTRDKDYDIIWFTESCLDNVLRLETYIQDADRAGDEEVATLFRKAQAESRKGAEDGKKLLRARLSG